MYVDQKVVFPRRHDAFGGRTDVVVVVVIRVVLLLLSSLWMSSSKTRGRGDSPTR